MKLQHNNTKIECGKVTDLVKKALKKLDSFFSKMQAFQDEGASKPKAQKFKVYPASETEGVYVNMTLTPRGDDGEYVDVELTTADGDNKEIRKAIRFDMPELKEIMNIAMAYMDKYYNEDGISDIEPIQECMSIGVRKITANHKPEIQLQAITSSQSYNDTVDALADIVNDESFIESLPEGEVTYFDVSQTYELYEITTRIKDDILYEQLSNTLNTAIRVKCLLDVQFNYVNKNIHDQVESTYSSSIWIIDECIAKLSSLFRELDLCCPVISINDIYTVDPFTDEFIGLMNEKLIPILSQLKLLELSLASQEKEITVANLINDIENIIALNL